ncbi:MAG: GNAT family N-acetyltransferase [Janthinobacterium lividum]
MFCLFLIISFQANNTIASNNAREANLKYMDYEGDKVGVHHPIKSAFLLYHEDKCHLTQTNNCEYEFFVFDICVPKNSNEIVNQYIKPYTEVGLLWTQYYTENNKIEDRQHCPYTVYVTKLEVYQEYKRKGYGQTAFEIMMEALPSIREVKQFTLNTGKHNIPAVKLYQKLGFEIYKTEEYKSSLQVFMSKNNL